MNSISFNNELWQEDWKNIKDFPNYEINNYGQIRLIGQHFPINTHVRSSGKIYVILKTPSGKNVEKNIDILTVRAFNEDLLEDDIFIPIITYRDNNLNNTHIDNLLVSYAIKTIRRKHDTMKGFYYIPGFSNYLINIKGEVYSLLNNIYMKINQSTGYKCVAHMTNDNSDRISNCHIHRLLALTFIPIPEKCFVADKYYHLNAHVHHKNGNKLNNAIDLDNLYGAGTNLEWLTPREHFKLEASLGNAGAIKLKPVKYKNPITGQIISYDSIIDCAHALKFSPSMLVCYLKLNKTYNLQGYGQFKYADDNSDWIDTNQLEISDKAETRIIVKNLQTGKFTEHQNQIEAAKFLGVKRYMINQRLYSPDKEVRNMPLNGYMFKFAHNYEDCKDWTPSPVKKIDALAIAVKVFHVISHTDKCFDNIHEACKYMCISKNTFYKRIKETNNMLPYNGWLFCYAKDFKGWPTIESFDKSVFVNRYSKTNTAVKLYNILTAEVTEHDSIRTASKYIFKYNNDPFKFSQVSTLHRRLTTSTRQNVPYKGFLIKYADDDTPWVVNNNPQRKEQKRVPVDMYNIKTGEYISKLSLTKAAKIAGSNTHEIVRYKLKNKENQRVPYKDWLFKYSSDDIDLRTMEYVESKNMSKSIIVEDVITGKEISYSSIASAAKDLDIGKKKIYHRLDNDILLDDRYKFKTINK